MTLKATKYARWWAGVGNGVVPRGPGMISISPFPSPPSLILASPSASVSILLVHADTTSILTTRLGTVFCHAESGADKGRQTELKAAMIFEETKCARWWADIGISVVPRGPGAEVRTSGRARVKRCVEGR